jgi:drug efflux transport system permease protein
MISALARTQAQAILGMFLFMVPAVMLSGFATPIASMPDWIQYLTLVNPIRWFIAILRGLFLRGSGWDFVWPQLWPMLAIAGASLAVGYARIGRRLD